ncbi:ImmA/IrrE family metallo-endopeptidase [Candidatus Desantisbacteria bacterium]|nr:ImmA/IrrE family metallo-endopeptidase [Candidatus Desantisbacteria bacterium]
MIDKAYITPEVFKWARKSARISEETAADKVHVSVKKLKEWEDGITQPSIRQAEVLAKAYRRPFALFFLPEVPKDFQPLQDFRTKKAKPLSTASIFIIREIQQKQAWIREVFEEDKESPLPFIGRFTIKDDPLKVATDILNTLKIYPPKYSTDNPIKEWIYNAELHGIFISRTSFIHSRLKLDCEEIQGFTISDPYAPFVFVNSNDWNAPQLFTLIHELAHIWIAESGISNDIEPELKHKDQLHPIELFCNEVAANVLLPAEEIKKINLTIFNSAKDIFKISKTFGVSTFSFLVRAFNLQIITLNKYQILKKEAEKEFQAFLKHEEEKKAWQKKQKGGPSYYLLNLYKNSRLFTQIVLDAFYGGFIEPTLASSLLNTQVNKFSKFEELIYK